MRIPFICATFVFALLSFLPAHASDKVFFTDIRGEWSGPGEIVAGKYKGTKFVCTFGGTEPETAKGMSVDGACRVGVFSRPMNAEIIKTAGRYIGSFLDGEKGQGMDITGGRYTKNRLVVEIKRNKLNGIMVANLSDRNRLKVTISVRHNNKLVPVIGMNLARKSDPIVTGSTN
ncbi:MAG: hypothetical protein AAF217_05075 [Pseudomonadota bacterium]